MIGLLNLVLLCAVLVVIAWSITCWQRFILDLSSGKDPLPAVPRPPVPWGLFDLASAVGIVFFLQLLFQAALLIWLGDERPASIDDPGVRTWLIAASTLASLIGLAAVMAFISFRTGATLADFGFDPQHFDADLGLGAKAFVMLAVPVFILQGILTMWFPSNHPLIDIVRQQSDPWLSFSVTAVAAVIGAPLLEEFGFRVLLQGWLEGLRGGDNALPRALVGASAAELSVKDSSESADPGGAVDPAATAPIEALLVPEAAPADGKREPAADLPIVAPNPCDAPRAILDEPQPAATEKAPPVWPIGISAFLFAISHWSHGPDWIPLLVLAVGLGYLYRQTHRVMPVIVVHFLLNATSMGLFALGLAFGPAQK